MQCIAQGTILSAFERYYEIPDAALVKYPTATGNKYAKNAILVCHSNIFYNYYSF